MKVIRYLPNFSGFDSTNPISTPHTTCIFIPVPDVRRDVTIEQNFKSTQYPGVMVYHAFFQFLR